MAIAKVIHQLIAAVGNDIVSFCGKADEFARKAENRAHAAQNIGRALQLQQERICLFFDFLILY